MDVILKRAYKSLFIALNQIFNRCYFVTYSIVRCFVEN